MRHSKYAILCQTQPVDEPVGCIAGTNNLLLLYNNLRSDHRVPTESTLKHH